MGVICKVVKKLKRYLDTFKKQLFWYPFIFDSKEEESWQENINTPRTLSRIYTHKFWRVGVNRALLFNFSK